MPLPTQDMSWPPADIAELLPDIARLDAWWTGDPDTLRTAYTGALGRLHPGLDETGRRVRTSQYDGGVVGAVSRMFWGKPPTNTSGARHQLHVPIGSDLCQASADILFAEEPQVTVGPKRPEPPAAAPVPEKPEPQDPSELAEEPQPEEPEQPAAPPPDPAQERLEELLDDHTWQTLSEGAEAGAALGGTYFRITVDTDISPTPFITRVDYDGAWPEFRWGRLLAVTFWWIVREEGTTVWRHLERHELDPAGNGIILHGLYEGSREALGRAVPLTDDPSTANLAKSVDADTASTSMPRTPGLCAVHVPNQRPNRKWRKHRVGQHLGRSDLAGVEGLMDSLDEVYTSWMRDIRLGKGRIFTTSAALDDNGPGAGATFDADREVFTELNVLQRQEASGLPIQAVQFAIRFQEHKETCEELVNRILQTSGYSAATFGEYEGGAMTATEIRSRERRTFLTRDRKVRIYRPALRTLFRKLLDVDRALNPADGVEITDDMVLDVEFPDGVVDSLLQIAQTAQTLRAAEAASTEVLVQMVHPEWSEQEVAEEVARIQEERAPAPSPLFEDPEGVGEGGANLGGQFGADDGSEEDEEAPATP